jgi:AraC-like DNA-binding protein
MKSDSNRPPSALDPIQRAHLKDPHDASHAMHQYPAEPEFDGFLQRFWIPVWSVPPGREAPQQVLQYPVSLVVVAGDYARFYGVVSGLSTTTLTGTGWAVGVMCAPAAGALLGREPMSRYTDRYVDVTEVLGAAGERLTARVREAMASDPSSPAAHRVAMAAFGDALRPFLPVDEDGLLVNRVVAFVEGDREVTRVAQVCERFGLSERSLQRLVHRRLGLTPKWLIQRRRLQEAAERLRTGPAGLGDVAALLGYADQAHFTRDFARVTSMTPGQFAARHVPERERRPLMGGA